MNDPTRHRPGNYTPETLYGMNHIAKAATSEEPTEARVIDVARSVLINTEIARVQHHQPVNGSPDYFTVEFAGSRIEFKLDWDNETGWGGNSAAIGELSNKAAAAATAINDLLFDIAKRSAALAMRSQQSGNSHDLPELRPPGIGGFVGMHFDECAYFKTNGREACDMDCCS